MYGRIKTIVLPAALRFFNVYGPNEHHKGSQASLITKIISDLYHKNERRVNLFQNKESRLEPGTEMRDHVYVKDVCEVITWLLDEGSSAYGIFNVGTGTARTWLDVVKAIEMGTGTPLETGFVDMPKEIAAHYQYYTQADLTNLRKAGYNQPFISIEQGIANYVRAHWSEQVLEGYWA
jgi:ADP-L-glycero-D-manno-heptose 6-epimerase